MTTKKLKAAVEEEGNLLAKFVEKIEDYKAVFLLSGGTEVIGKIVRVNDTAISVQEITGRDEYTPIITEIARSRIYAFKLKLEISPYEDDDDDEFGEDD